MDNLQPVYAASRALVVGINQYSNVSPLSYAVNDAEAIAELLVDAFKFPPGNVQVLLNEEATRSNVMESFLGFAGDKCSPDDRIVFFFAGHGHTRPGRRQEIGYLIPVDGDIDNLASLVRWDDLTRNAELIPAKHLLFVMDACYGGLALVRALAPGSVRFVRRRPRITHPICLTFSLIA